MQKRTLTLALIAAVTMGLVVISQGSALTLVPPSIEYKVEKGQVINDQIRLINEENKTVTLRASTALFGPKDETGQPGFAFDVPTADLASWIKIETSPFTLGPGEKKEIPFSITVPANAEPGGHYASIFFASGGTAEEGEGKVAIASKLGTLLIVTIAGDIREQGNVEQFTIAGKQGTRNRLPVDLVVRIQNSGNVHFKPRGTVTVHNMFGGVATTLQLNENDSNVLPNQIRRFDLSWTKKAEPKKHGFFDELGSEFSNFSLGTYTATLEAIYGSTNQALISNVKFTIIPWRVLLVLGIGLIVVIFLLVWAIKSYNRTIIRRAQAGTKTNSPSKPPEKKE